MTGPVPAALILAGGDLDHPGAQAHLFTGPWNIVVAVDRGAAHARRLGLKPSVLVGDMDSIDPGDRRALQPVPEVVYPAAKDKSDTQLAVEWALHRGARRIVIAGGIGNRFDHSLANAHLLLTIERHGAAGVVTDGRQALYLLSHRLRLKAPAGHVLSVLPLGPDCRGLSERGLRWELEDHDPVLGNTLTLSNEFLGRPAELRLRHGFALVVTGPPDGPAGERAASAG
ncbi:MAG: thiamine diphosphokinase [Firmicutes bacterium]|nr:thiamine diphosphokinase [Bacillota bacterium]